MSSRAGTMGEERAVRDRPAGAPADRRLISIVTPAFNEAKNLPVLYERLRATMDALQEAWEWVIVDDHSRDDTFAVITALSARDPRVRGLRFTRNFGAHTALMCALHHARGDCVANLAADLQDPPEVIPLLVERWKAGAKVVWAARDSREGESATTIGFARLYYWVMRHLVGLKEMPPTGADLFLADGAVIDAFSRFNEGNATIQGLITWMGFEQVTIGYDKGPRLHGASGWSLKKKLKLLVDSITSFSYFPIRFMSYLGVLLGFLGFIYAGFVILNRIHGHPIEGWSSLVVVVLLVGGVQMVMMGVLGEYLWRALDESRRRPRYIIESTTPTRSASSVE